LTSLRKPKKNLSFDALRKALSEHFDNLADPRTADNSQYTVHDTLMSAFACMYFQDPSLLAFQARLEKKHQRSNMQSIFRVRKTPKDSQLRELIDRISAATLAPCFKDIHERLRRSKYFEDYAVFPETLMCVIDGTTYHSSKLVNCKHCLHKTSKSGETTYSHGVLQGAIMHPDKKQVFPVMPEAISNEDGSKKQDCETNAAKRFIEQLRRDYPRQKFILGGDGLMSHQPMIETVMDNDMHYLFVAKPGDHKYLYEWIETFDTLAETSFYSDKGRRHVIRWQNDVPLKDGDDAVRVNFVEYQQFNEDAKMTFRNTWVTDIPLTQDNAVVVARAGRCRWKIENECFNSLKNQGYELTHNYGHGKAHLSLNMYLLTLLAFTFHQVFELTDGMYQACREASGAKTRMWEDLRALMKRFLVEDWQHLMDMLINENDYETTAIKRV
jgi:hypothetical protein